MQDLPPSNLSSEELLALATAHESAGRGEEAEEACRAALAADPSHGEAQKTLNKLLKKKKNAKKSSGRNRPKISAKKTKSTTARSPRSASGTSPPSSPREDELHQLSDFYNQGRFIEAEALARALISQHPHHLFAWNVLGAALKAQGQLDDAITTYRQAIEMKPDLADFHNNLGNALRDNGELDEAVARFREAIRLNPDIALAHHNLANALKDLGELGAALAGYQEALRLAPDFAAAQTQLGLTLQAMGQLEEAEGALLKAGEMTPKNEDIWTNLGIVHLNLDNLEKAEESLRKAIELNPEFVEAHLNLGLALQHQDQPEAAYACYSRAMELNPEKADTLENLAIALESLDKKDDAIAMHKRAIEIDPENSILISNLGNTYRCMGRTDEALAMFVQSLQLDPDDSRTRTLFIQTAENVALGDGQQASDDLVSTLLLCLRDDNLETSSLSTLTQSALLADMPEALTEASRHPGTPLDITGPDFRAFADGPLLLTFLARTILASRTLETLLTKARRGLLEMLAESEDALALPEELQSLALALAEQGLLNEYVWAVTPGEKALVETLRARVATQIKNGQAPSEISLYLLAAYEPLSKIDGMAGWASQAGADVSDDLQRLLRVQVVEPVRENEIAEIIDVLTAIDDDVSQAVQAQYEDNPYPRWARTTKSIPIPYTRQILNEIQPHRPVIQATTERPEILIAGCGTGKQPINVALRFKNSQVLAVDLSRTSLAYAVRKAEEGGVDNIRFAQADILKLGAIKQTFDIIESGGVLHHMADPEAGLKVLVGLLRPGGFFKLGLYSELSREHIVRLRQQIAEQKLDPSLEGIREFRTQARDSESEDIAHLWDTKDFFATSMVRDLLFHVQEHRFTIPQIRAVLERNGLRFLGFTFTNMTVKTQYAEKFPDDSDMTNLDNWHQYELENPRTFAGMYQFWTQKA